MRTPQSKTMSIYLKPSKRRKKIIFKITSLPNTHFNLLDEASNSNVKNITSDEKRQALSACSDREKNKGKKRYLALQSQLESRSNSLLQTHIK